MTSPDPTRRFPTFAVLFSLFSLELIAISIARLPESMRFDRYAFCDHGANLTLQYLISKGLRPSIDFGYHYGLLPALVGHVWFAVLGATPQAYQLAMGVFSIIFAWALAKILVQLKIGSVGLALTIVALGYAYQATYINFAHAIEAALLSHALAEQACGRRGNALLLASVSVFAKPSMGYLYSLLLLVLIIRQLVADGFSFRRWFSALAPTAIVFVSLAVVLVGTYGFPAFYHTVFPIEGAVSYKALNFGITRAGRELWDPKGTPWIFYFIDVSGFWIAGTIFLFCTTAYQICWTYLGKISSTRRSEIIITCAILHLAFVALFFGNQWSWIYYSYVLVIGCAIAVEFGKTTLRFGLVLCALAFFSWTDVAYWTYRWGRTTEPNVATAGLWAPVDERTEWLTVLSKVRGQKTVLLSTMGAAELLFPGFEEPVSLYLTKGLMATADVERKIAQISKADIVVVPSNTIGSCSGVPQAPEFDAAMKEFELQMSGKYFDVYQRKKKLIGATSPDSPNAESPPPEMTTPFLGAGSR
jgi:hypothetical protein